MIFSQFSLISHTQLIHALNNSVPPPLFFKIHLFVSIIHLMHIYLSILIIPMKYTESLWQTYFGFLSVIILMPFTLSICISGSNVDTGLLVTVASVMKYQRVFFFLSLLFDCVSSSIFLFFSINYPYAIVNSNSRMIMYRFSKFMYIYLFFLFLYTRTKETNKTQFKKIEKRTKHKKWIENTKRKKIHNENRQRVKNRKKEKQEKKTTENTPKRSHTGKQKENEINGFQNREK